MSISIDELTEFRDQLQKLADDADEINEMVTKELAARLLRKVIKRTPVDSGNLRRGWAVGKYIKFGAGKLGVIHVKNSIFYAPYIESGHRTRGGKGFVSGYHMLELSENEIRASADGIAQKIVDRELGKRMK